MKVFADYVMTGQLISPPNADRALLGIKELIARIGEVEAKEL